MSIGRGTEPLYSSLSKRYGAFFQRAHDLLRRWKKRGRAGEKGDWGGERGRVVAFQLLYKPSEPSLSRPLVISECCFQTQCNRGIIY